MKRKDSPYVIIGLNHEGVANPRLPHNAGPYALERLAEQLKVVFDELGSGPCRIARLMDGKKCRAKLIRTFTDTSLAIVVENNDLVKAAQENRLLVIQYGFQISPGLFSITEADKVSAVHNDYRLRALLGYLGCKFFRLRIGIGQAMKFSHAPGSPPITHDHEGRPFYHAATLAAGEKLQAWIGGEPLVCGSYGEPVVFAPRLRQPVEFAPNQKNLHIAPFSRRRANG